MAEELEALSPEEQAQHFYLEAMRLQGRKDYYKTRVARVNAQLQKEREMNAIWKRATWSLAAVAAVLAVGTLLRAEVDSSDVEEVFLEDSPEDEALAALSRMPDHVWATGVIYNGHTGGSAVVICEGEEKAMGLSCGHCFDGRIGGTFWYSRADGKAVEATLEAHLPYSGYGKPELALFSISPDDVLGTAPIAVDVSPGELDVIGYPGLVGPKYHPLRELKGDKTDFKKYAVTDGGYLASGNSGSPIFKDGMVVGILSGVNDDVAGFQLAGYRAQQRRAARQEMKQETGGHPKVIGTTAVVTKQEAIVNFVLASKKRFKGGGNPFCDKNGNCYDANGQPVQKLQPKAEPTAPGNRPLQPNLPMTAAPNRTKNSGETDVAYDGKKRPPEDLRGNKKQAVAIDKLRKSTNLLRPEAIDEDKIPAPLPGQGDAVPPAPGPSPPDLSHLNGLPISLEQLHGKFDAQIGVMNQKLDRLGLKQLTPADLDDIKKALGKAVTPDQVEAVKEAMLEKIKEHGVDLKQAPADFLEAIKPELAKSGQALLENGGPILAKAAITGVSAIVPGPWTLLGMAGVAGGLPMLSNLFNGWRARKQAAKGKGQPPPGVSGGGEAAPSGIGLDDLNALEQRLTSKFSKLVPTLGNNRLPRRQPASVAAPADLPAPIQQVSTVHTESVNPEFINAYGRAKQRMAQKEPGSRDTVRLFESILNQELGGAQLPAIK